MADFLPAYQQTLRHEGGYVNDPDDPGRETYKGISRKHHPGWAGWDIIDAYKGTDHFEQQLANHIPLEQEVQQLYQSNYWDPLYGAQIPVQGIAEELFDTAVNQGKERAVKYLQRALNLLNRQETIYTDVIVDGYMGPQTLNAIHRYLEHDTAMELVTLQNGLQLCHYISITEDNTRFEKYLRGWLTRVTLTRRPA